MERSGRLAVKLGDIRPQPANLLLEAAWVNRVLEIFELALPSGRTRLDMTGSIVDLGTRLTVDKHRHD